MTEQDEKYVMALWYGNRSGGVVRRKCSHDPARMHRGGKRSWCMDCQAERQRDKKYQRKRGAR